MIEEGIAASPRPSQGILASARNFLATLVDIVATRVEIVSNELEEERLRLGSMAAWAACTFLFAALALIFFSFLVVAVFWDEHRIAATACVGGFYVVLAIIAGAHLRSRIERKSKLFATTVEELRKDQARLLQ
jgi:uncharacterized membrane protein YqjE